MPNLTDAQWREYYIKSTCNALSMQESIAEEFSIPVKDINQARMIGFIKLYRLENNE